MSLTNKKSGFTLAEVLVTVGLIGTISAITIPTLAYNYRGKVLEQQFRTTYSDIKEIGSRINSDRGDVGQYANKTGLAQWVEEFISYLPGGGPYNKDVNSTNNIDGAMQNIYREAGGGAGPFQFNMVGGKKYGGVYCDNYGIWSDSKGRIWTFNSESRIICVDINGTAPPNTYNIDLFAFIPMNAHQVGTWVYNDPNHDDNYSGQIVPCDADKIRAKGLSNKMYGRDCKNPGNKGDGCVLDACPFNEPIENIAVMAKDDKGNITGDGQSARGRKMTLSNNYWKDYINYK